MTYKGIPNVKHKYVGDGLHCDLNNPESCKVEVADYHAASLLADFPNEWEVNELDLQVPLEKFIKQSDYRNKMIAHSIATKGVVVSYPDGSEMTYPAGCEIKVIYPKDRHPVSKSVSGTDKQQAWRNAVKKANGNMEEAKKIYKEMGY